MISYNDIFGNFVARSDGADSSATRETGDRFTIRGVTCAVTEIEFRKAAVQTRFCAIPIEALNPACEDEETALIRIRVGGTADVFILGVVEGLVDGVYLAYRLARPFPPNKKRIWSEFPFCFNI